MRTIVESLGVKYKDHPLDLIVQYNITYKCNYHCSYCEYVNLIGEEISIDQHMELLTYLKDLNGNNPIKITLIGGEPTLYKGFNEVLDYSLDKIAHSKNMVMVFSNGSQYKPKFEASVNLLEKHRDNVFYLMTLHPFRCDLNSIVDKLTLLQKNHISYKLFMMMEPNQFKWIKNAYEVLYNKFKLVNHDKNYTLEMTAIQPIENQGYSQEELDFANDINNSTDFSDIETDYYYVIEEAGIKRTETYTMSKMRLMDDQFYFNFKGMNCKAYSQIRIEPNGNIATRCDRFFQAIGKPSQNLYFNFFKEPELRDKFKEMITKGVICTRTNCPERCYLLLIPKYRKG